MSDTRQSTAGDGVLWTIAIFYAALWVAKFLIAANLDLFYDEATYWQASLRPAFGITDCGYIFG